MKSVVDHLGRKITYKYPPKRIVSLCPAITETLFHLQLQEEVVGRTRFCIHPHDEVKTVINVGGTKDIKLERIQQLQPDLIIAEKEENTKEMVAALEVDYPVYVFEIQTIQDASRMIHDLGELTDRRLLATELNAQIDKAFARLPKMNGQRVAYVIWQHPFMVVGQDTYIQTLLESMGFVNPFTSFAGRYPEVTAADLQAAKLDYLFLATEPFPFREQHQAEFDRLLPDTSSFIVDGEMFWYGPKMLEAAAYFRRTFHSFT